MKINKRTPAILLAIFSFTAFNSCKKDDCPTPTPVPVQNKLIIYTTSSLATSEGIIVGVKEQGAAEYTHLGVLTETYSNVPSCDAAYCFTIPVTAGKTYVIEAEAMVSTTTWGPTNITIQQNSGCNPFKLL